MWHPSPVFYKVFKDLLKLFLLLVLLLLFSISLIKRYGLILNTTASYPVGIYTLTSQERYVKGDLVVFCPPATLRYKTNNIGLIIPHSSECPSGTGTLMKKIVGTAGDYIFVGKEVWVNNKKQSKSFVYYATSKDVTLYACFGSHIVENDSVWLMSDYEEKSFDSRYFCEVPIENIVGKANMVLPLPVL